MLKLHSQQHIRFAKVDRGDAWVVVAVLFETTGNETVAISEPKIVKVIPKAQYALPSGSKTHQVLLLAAPAQVLVEHAIASPYFTQIFGYSDSNFITGIAPQPPTK
jgi:hypothetical protein